MGLEAGSPAAPRGAAQHGAVFPGRQAGKGSVTRRFSSLATTRRRHSLHRRVLRAGTTLSLHNNSFHHGDSLGLCTISSLPRTWHHRHLRTAPHHHHLRTATHQHHLRAASHHHHYPRTATHRRYRRRRRMGAHYRGRHLLILEHLEHRRRPRRCRRRRTRTPAPLNTVLPRRSTRGSNFHRCLRSRRARFRQGSGLPF